MDFFLLILSILLLLLALTKVSKVKYSNSDSIFKDAKLNVISLLWGVLIIATIIFIPYQVWVLTGSSTYWDGAYIVLGTALITAIISFVFYFKIALISTKRV
ncbi:hypothetical protein JOC85_001869 [Bacillus mesophilus]|uniref:Uncharacterized protein n=1 Tax=Bacillus mesophilus TaxID=1808955 RepID=A0A6M0Q7E8_9BACI|nr:hypothetical protein [Bacillus mesophilus]MBM7661097.1 hypothetical protein [Bacillus mesophilus]NEY71370.1 hypothetical protein [Bacillus mesophilus]